MFILFVGSFLQHTSSALAGAAKKAGVDCAFAPTVEEGLLCLHGVSQECRCIFVQAGRLLDPLLQRLGSDIDYGTIPVVSLTQFPSQEAYSDSLKLGVTDCIDESDTGGVFRRITNVVQGVPERTAAFAGRALVAISEEESRRVVGRRLHAAGYDVDFVLSEEELRTKAGSKTKPALIVAGEAFPPLGAAGAIQVARSAADANDIPGIVVPSRRGRGGSARELTDPEIVNRLMFLVEEARVGVRGENRASRRLQDSMTCTFRSARSFQPTYALTDNISWEGLYLRTMDPPAQHAEVIIEMLSDQGEILHLKGVVAWRHVPARTGGTKPAGFGFRLNQEACSPVDLAIYQEFYGRRLSAVVEAESQMPSSMDPGRVTVPAVSPKAERRWQPSVFS